MLAKGHNGSRMPLEMDLLLNICLQRESKIKNISISKTHELEKNVSLPFYYLCMDQLLNICLQRESKKKEIYF